ncbi:SDR family NAD(P)-dependent oxidoreductase [Streptosporangium sp. CA-115845]|uniref:SDR family NAD(P)-dependent oxidoreductase n=1 Tax=Streptosporangium sp. CA-115845 TaxID=3240071 RepID=UPI003D8B140A
MGGNDGVSLAGRRALVTGASRGIGAAIARRFAEQGADVVLAARSKRAIETLATELGELGGRVVAIPADMADRDSLRELMDEVDREFGGLDILVNNAGVLPPATRAERMDWADWDATLGLNLSAPWYLACRAKGMMGAGGVIVNNASTAAYFPSRGLVGYNVSKSALIMLTRVLALEWAADGVRVVGVAPGKIETDLVQPILRWTEKHDMPLNPLRRIGVDREVADLVSFLVSPQAGYITGVTIPIDGGELLTAGSEPGR